MSQINRRYLLGAGSSLLAVAALTQRAPAAGSPGLTTHMLDVASGTATLMANAVGFTSAMTR